MQGAAFWRLDGARRDGADERRSDYTKISRFFPKSQQPLPQLMLPSFEVCCAREVTVKQRFSLEPRLYPPPKRQKAVFQAGESTERSLCAESSLWTHKYRPRTRSDIVGNQVLISRLHTWLQTWEENFASKTRSVKNVKRAVIISGPSGVGKTSAAVAVCEELDFSPVMAVHRKTWNIRADNQCLTTNLELSKKVVLIFDEIDNIDETAIQAVLSLLQQGRLPIMCICNDFYDKRLRRLMEYCSVLKFQKPSKSEILKLLIQVQEKECLRVDKLFLSSLVDSAHRDVRHVLIQMQYACAGYSLNSGVDVRDACLGSFGTMDSLCAEAGEGRGAKTLYTIEARLNMVLQDVGFIFLLVQENYLNYKPCRGASILNTFSKASDYLCDGDVMDKSICRGRRELSELFSMILVLTCSSILQGTRQSFDTTADHKLRFPMWLSKSSKKRNLSFKRCDLDTPSFLKEQLKISVDDNPKNVQHFSSKAPDPTRASEDLFAILRHR